MFLSTFVRASLEVLLEFLLSSRLSSVHTHSPGVCLTKFMSPMEVFFAQN